MDEIFGKNHRNFAEISCFIDRRYKKRGKKLTWRNTVKNRQKSPKYQLGPINQQNSKKMSVTTKNCQKFCDLSTVKIQIKKSVVKIQILNCRAQDSNPSQLPKQDFRDPHSPLGYLPIYNIMCTRIHIY